jgi:hypothetical protein
MKDMVFLVNMLIKDNRFSILFFHVDKHKGSGVKGIRGCKYR